MSAYEKIASAFIVILLAIVLVLSRGMYAERRGGEEGTLQRTTSDFDESVGQDFVIGPFTTTASEQSSGGTEDNCDNLQPVIIATLHDIYKRLESRAKSFGNGDAWNSFEVNESALGVLCNKNARIILMDKRGNRLLLDKIPFARAIPPGGTSVDVGTRVRMNAAIAPAGAPAPGRPDAYGEILIPDRFLDIASSSSPTGGR